MTVEPQLPYPPDVNAALSDLLEGVRAILGDHFRALYLSGSLALGDFVPERSDIDIVVVTDTALSDDLLFALREMHARFNAGDSPWATEIEAAYIPQAALSRYDPAHAYHPHIERGVGETLAMDQFDIGWIIQRAILREHGVAITGPHPAMLIDPVSPQDLHRAVVTLLGAWWEPMCRDPRPLYRHEIGYQPYAVLTMCRMLYTLEFAAVVSKPVAAHWAQGVLGEPWAALIARALAWRKDRPSMPSGDDLNDTLRLIQYTHQRGQEREAPSLTD